MRLSKTRRAVGLLAIVCLPAIVHAQLQDDPHRLARDVRPLHQSVSLRLDPDSPEYTGSTEIRIVVDAPCEFFRLHAQDIAIDELTLSDGERSIPVRHEKGENDLLIVTPESALGAGEYVLAIGFHNDFDTTSKSLYRVIFENQGYLFTQFEDEDARGAFPCWDEPFFKIPWDLTLSAPAQYAVVANMPEASASVADGWRTAVYQTTPPLPSYLIAMAVGPFDFVPVEGMGVPGNVVCPRGKAHLAGEAAAQAGPIVKALEAYFGRPYPYPKLDFIAVPEFWPGAMENPGAITYRDNLLLIDPERMTSAERSRLAYVHAHEIAHQWFGNLVTMEWWDDLWLNESFATWLGVKITDQVFPEFGRSVSQAQSEDNAMQTDAQTVVGAIRRPIRADEVKMSDPSLTYAKGSAVLGMFESFIGEDLFREGVVHYIDSNEFSSATAADLWEALGEKAGVDVASAMATFLDQPGVPRVEYNLLGDGKVELRQTRFSNHGNDAPEQTWQVPIVFRYDAGNGQQTHRVLLDQPSQVVELPGGHNPQWIHPNADERGYFRWSLDPKLLQELTSTASERMDKRERVALVGQLSALLDAGDLDGGSYLEAIGRLSADPDAEVLDAMLGALEKLRQAFVTDALEPAFAQYVNELLGEAYRRYGPAPVAGEAEAVGFFRPSMLRWLGVYGRDAAVVAFAEEATSRILEDPASVDPSIAGVCLQVASLSGDWKLYNAFRQRFEAAQIPAERNRYLGALGYFEKEAIAKASLEYAIAGQVRPQEMFSIVQGVGAVQGDSGLIWTWLQGNYERMQQRLPDMFMGFMPFFAGGCTDARIAEAESFFAMEEHRAPGVDENLAKVKEASLQCAGLREREGESVARFLGRYSASSGR